MILFLDDSEQRIELFRACFPSAMIVNTAEQAIEHLRDDAVVWSSVWLDHDLGGTTFQDSDDRESGYEVVRWILANRPTILEVYVHTWNPSAGANMVIDLQGAGYIVHRWPFDPNLLFAGVGE
jgi:hypothetical protein